MVKEIYFYFLLLDSIILQMTLWSKYIWASLVVWITWDLNLVGPLSKTVYENIWGIGIVLHVFWDSASPTKNRLKAWIDHIDDSYEC
jgi:hypothetical protein